MNLQFLEIAGGVLGAIAVMVLIVRAGAREVARRGVWFKDAKEALPPAFGAFQPAEIGSDGFFSLGTFDGDPARFAADKTTTTVALEVSVPKGVDRGALFDLIVRESQGSLETGSDGIRAGWDDEHSRIVLRTGGGRSGAETVKKLLDEAKSFRADLPRILAEAAKEKDEQALRVFGDQTGEDGKHRFLGIGLALPMTEWELARDRLELVEWERIPGEAGEALPAELRLIGVAQDPALADADPRERLVARVLAASVERLADGSFGGPPPDVDGRSGPDVAGFKTAVAAVDYAREVVLDEEKTEQRPYRSIVQAVFVPWAVLVLELAAPRGEADGLMAKILAGAAFEAPSKKD
jgi:hypothetical protein